MSQSLSTYILPFQKQALENLEVEVVETSSSSSNTYRKCIPSQNSQIFLMHPLQPAFRSIKSALHHYIDFSKSLLFNHRKSAPVHIQVQNFKNEKITKIRKFLKF
jgi:hypothetical protein